jgi:hypothetical protein
MPEWLQKMAAGRRSPSEAWAEMSGYVAGMVQEGSDDAARVLGVMHEFRPSTRLFTGSVDDLRGEAS